MIEEATLLTFVWSDFVTDNRVKSLSLWLSRFVLYVKMGMVLSLKPQSAGVIKVHIGVGILYEPLI